MPHPEAIRNLFANYAAAVGHHLPLRGRKDIRRELEGTLADRLDDRLAGEGREATIEDAYALLKETGHPVKTAASYYAHHHLIGPELYPYFIMVVRVTLPVLATVLLAVLVITAALKPDPRPGALATAFQVLATTGQAVFTAFGVIVLVFMALERLDPAMRSKAEIDPFKPWDPRELGTARPGPEMKTGEQVASLVANLAGMVMLFFLPTLLARVIGLFGLSSDGVLWNPNLLGLLPLLLTGSATELLLAVYLLTRRQHSLATTVSSAGVKIFGAIIAGVVLGIWTFLVPGAGADPRVAGWVETANLVLRILCGVAIAGGCLEAGKIVFRHLRGTGEDRAD